MEPNNSGTVKVMIDRSAFVNNNNTGIKAFGAGATVLVGDSTVSGNGTGLATVSGGVINSYGTNKVGGNTSEGVPTNTIPMR